MGAISPHGLGAPAFWNALLEGKSSITKLTRFDPSGFPGQVASVIPAFKTTDFVPRSYRKSTKIMARDIELAVVAADFAVRDAKVITKGVAEGANVDELVDKGWTKVDPRRCGCNIGAGLICADLNELTEAMAEVRNPDDTMDLARWGKSDDPGKTSGMEKLTPLWLLKYLPNMLACHVSIIHDTQGPSNAITCGEASAGLAMTEAVRTIQRGQADMALAGGCESKVHGMGVMRWNLLDLYTKSGNENPEGACRPYDRAAAGAVLAEGGAVFVIEEYEHAKARGVAILAELVGFGASANASASPVEPDTTGEAPAVAIRKALKDAGIGAEDVDVIVPPALSVPAWDQADAVALRTVFGAGLAKVNVLPARAGGGNCGAGSQALDMVAAVMALRQQVVPGAINVPEPIGGLNIAAQKVSRPVRHVLVLGSALSGQNSAIILKRTHEANA